jgi:4-amino-4-deoxy-L-arabinose transferase-like glycosyltransferase
MDRKSISWTSFFLILLGIVFHLFGLGGYDIYILDEAKNAEAAREMWVSGDWIVPRFNGQPRYDKPPLHYYFFSLGYQIFGVNAFGARFFSAVMGVVTFLAVFFKVWKRKDQKSAQIAMLALLASPHFLIQFHLAVPDPFLICFLTLSLMFLETYIASEYSSHKAVRWSYLFLGLAVLSKGPLAIVLLGLSVFIFSIFYKGSFWKNFRNFLDFPAILMFLLVVLPWYVLVALETNGSWLEEFIFHHNLNRFSNAMEGHGGPFYLPPLMVFLGFLPASVLLFLGFSDLKNKIRDQPLFALSLIFSVVILVFFMFSKTKLPNYTAPIYPFLAIILALNSEAIFQRKWLIVLLIMSSIVLIVLGISLKILGPKISELAVYPNLWMVVLPSAVLAAVAALFLFTSKKATGFTLICFSYIALSLGLLGFGFPQVDAQNPVKSALGFLPSGAVVYYWKEFNPAFPFNMQKVISSWEEGEFSEESFVLTTSRALEDHSFPQAYEEVFREKDLFEKTETVLIRPLFSE